MRNKLYTMASLFKESIGSYFSKLLLKLFDKPIVIFSMIVVLVFLITIKGVHNYTEAVYYIHEESDRMRKYRVSEEEVLVWYGFATFNVRTMNKPTLIEYFYSGLTVWNVEFYDNVIYN